MRFTVCLLAGFVLLLLPGHAQDFLIGNYRAVPLIGNPRLEQHTDYISFSGDFGFAGSLPPSDRIQKHLAHESRLLANFNLRVINFEFTLQGGRGGEFGKSNDITTIQILEKAGFDLVGLANNHALDSGVDGVKYNTARLVDAGLAITGTRDNPLYLWPAGGRSIALYALTDYTDHEDPQRSILRVDEPDLNFIRQQSAKADFRIAFVHLGSMGLFPSPHERMQVGRVIEAGADLVICTGSHFIKGYRTEKGKPVIYGIGNHLFSYSGGDTEPIGMHAIVGLRSGTLAQLFVIPFRNSLEKGDTGPLDESEFATFKHTLAERSTQDISRYFSDPRSLNSLKRSLADFRFSSIKDLRVRHLRYAAQILLWHYPIVGALGVIVLGVAAGLLLRWKRIISRRRAGSTSQKIQA